MFLFVPAARAQGEEPAAPPAPRLEIPRLDGEIEVDGRLDEPQWQRAAVVRDFHMYEPVEEGAVPGPIEARIFYDLKHIYIAVESRNGVSGSTRAHIAPREDINTDDQIGIYLDTYNDDRQAFVFQVNALGIQRDSRMTEARGMNSSWDTIFHSRGRATGEGFAVEVSIPFRSLRFPNAQRQEWGIILTRFFAAKGVTAIWPKVTHDRAEFIAQAATLTGLEGISSGKNLEILPTLVSQWGEGVNASEQQLRAPFTLEMPGQISVSPGLSVKYGITTNLTLDATVNPDFSQVEADPEQLETNRRWALFVEERRPFFLEGTETLSAAPYLSLYTRTVVSPAFGLKFTGKEGGTSIGLLTAYDTSPAASFTARPLVHPDYGWILSRGAPGFREADLTFCPAYDAEGQCVETPRRYGAQVSVGRVSRDLGQGHNVGLTVVDKEVIDPVEQRLYGYHRYVQADAQLLLSKTDRLTLSAEYNATGMRNVEAEDPTGLEQSGRDTDEYEQGLQAFGYFLNYRHITRKWYAQVNHGYEPEDFRAEASFLPVVGILFTDAYTNYLLEPKIPGVVFVRPGIYGNVFYDWANQVVTDLELRPSVNIRFKDLHFLEVNYGEHLEHFAFDDYRQQNVGLFFNSQQFKKVHFGLGLQEGTSLFRDPADPRLAYGFAPSVSVTFRPTAWLMGQLQYNRAINLEEPRFSALYAIDRLAGRENPDLIFDESAFSGLFSLNFSQAWSLRGTARMGALDMRDPSSGSILREGNFDWSALLTYLPHPGTAAYLGVSNGIDWSADGIVEDSVDWRVFLKLSYLWRI